MGEIVICCLIEWLFCKRVLLLLKFLVIVFILVVFEILDGGWYEVWDRCLVGDVCWLWFGEIWCWKLRFISFVF